MNNNFYSVNKNNIINVTWILLGIAGICYESYGMWKIGESFGSFYLTSSLPFIPFIIVSILAIIAGVGGLARKKWAKYVLALVSTLGFLYPVLIIIFFLSSIPTAKWEYFHLRITQIIWSVSVLIVLILSLTTIKNIKKSWK